jgi:hypothetical protein
MGELAERRRGSSDSVILVTVGAVERDPFGELRTSDVTRFRIVVICWKNEPGMIRLRNCGYGSKCVCRWSLG